MKKRILCAVLTLIMLVSLIPVGAISASAASLSTSDAAISVLKKMTGYEWRKFCYPVSDTQQRRIGYGTVCEKSHKLKDGEVPVHEMNEYQADQALRAYLKTLDKKLNSFASSNKLSLKQCQHDALAIFSYGVGTAWMNGNGAVKTAIVNDAGPNEMLSAMASIDNNMTRRKIEVNMYFNGIYSNVVPTNYGVVTYHANEGYMSQGDKYVMHFDKTQAGPHIPVPTKTGYTFLGWYTLDKNGTATWRYPSLNADCDGLDLYALWQKNGLKMDASLWEQLPRYQVDYTLKTSQLASLNVYDYPGAEKADEADTKWLKEQKTISVFQEYLDGDGRRWVDIAGRGWALWTGTPSDSADEEYGAEIDVTVTVTNGFVRRRKNASITSPQNGTYHKGDKVRIINTAEGSGFLWGQIAKSADDNKPIGWIALMYTDWDSIQDDNKSGNTTAIATATVTREGYLNLRSGAGTDNKIVGSVAHNDTVNIYEIKTVNGHQWGRTNGGWICLTYTDVTMLEGSHNENISNEGSVYYVFPGYLADTDKSPYDAPRVSPNSGAQFVQQTHTFKTKDENDKEITHTVNLWPESKETVNIHNMVIRGNETWAKISWRVDLDDNGEDDTTKYGWMPVHATDYNKDANLSLGSWPVMMEPVKFTVVSDELTVRETPSNSANAVPIKLNKGVEVQINAIKLVGENIWGYLDNENVYGGDGNNSTDKHYDGWINLASKYVSRNGITEDTGNDKPTPTGKTGTIVGADKVNVRITGSLSGKIIGKIARGTTANILETSANGKFYNLDIDVDGNPVTGTWVSTQYVEVNDGYVGDTAPDGTPAPVVTGIGVVANTYAGVNVRQGAGQSYASVGKLLPGTTVKIHEIKQAGAAKWARVDQGWVCMDYITMLKEETTYPGGNPADPNKGTAIGSYEELEKATTTAVYTGKIVGSVPIFTETVHFAAIQPLLAGTATASDVASESFVRYTNPGEPVTIYELIKVTEKVTSENNPGTDHGTEKEEITTSYWARTNDGYIYYPEANIELDALDEQVHTLRGEKLNIRAGKATGGADPNGKIVAKLKQGDQVKVTALDIINDKVWGRIEHEGETGWIRLDYMAEGAFYVEEKPSEPVTPPSNDPILGAGGSNGGFVNNSSGYRYKGRVINTNKVNVRATASQTAAVTTKLKSGDALVIYETTTSENMAWGRCDAGWVYLYYVDLTPVTGNGAIDSRVVANNVAAVIYSDANCTDTVGTYAGMSVVDIYEIVGEMARTDLGWVSVKNFL